MTQERGSEAFSSVRVTRHVRVTPRRPSFQDVWDARIHCALCTRARKNGVEWCNLHFPKTG